MKSILLCLHIYIADIIKKKTPSRESNQIFKNPFLKGRRKSKIKRSVVGGSSEPDISISVLCRLKGNLLPPASTCGKLKIK